MPDRVEENGDTARGGVWLEVSSHSGNIRAARMVAAAVARELAMDDSVVEDVRLAVGEACSGAIQGGAGARITVIPSEPRLAVQVAPAGAADDLRDAILSASCDTVENSDGTLTLTWLRR